MKEDKKFYYYSQMHRDLIAQLYDSDSLRYEKVGDFGELNAPLIKNYKYEYGSWPVVISNQRVTEMNHFFRLFKPLCYKVVKNFFASNQAFSQYLDYPEFILDILKELPDEIEGHIFRHDLVYCQDTFKILEVNAGSNIGGWQLDWLKENYQALLKSKDFSHDWNLDKANTIQEILRYIMTTIQTTMNPGQAHNIAFIVQYDHDDPDSIEFEFNKIYEQLKAELNFTGRLLWGSSLEEIQIDEQGLAYFNGVQLGGIMLNIADLSGSAQSKLLQLTQSFLNRKLVFPDSPFHLLLGNKSLLALLHDAIHHNLLDETEVQIIKQHIPWTHQTGVRYLHRDNEQYDAFEYVLKHKNQLVLKKARSMQGKDVFVGNFMDPKDWQIAVEKYISDPGWLIQQYCPPDEALMCEQSGWIGPYHFIWGVFDIDSSYCGAFIRASRAGQGDGIINSAQGAYEFLVFEEKKLRKVISI